MSYYNTLPFAASGLDITATEITNMFVKYVLGKFPYNTFGIGSVFIDTLGMVNDHKRRINGLEAAKNIPKPYVIVTNDGGMTDVYSKDDGSPDIKQFSMFPGTTDDRRLKNNHRLVLLTDKVNGIYIDTIEMRRRIELDFKFDFDTKSDISTIRSHLHSNLSIRKPSVLENLNTSIILPNSLVYGISRLAYKANEFSVSNPNDIETLVEYMNTNGVYDFSAKPKDVDNSDVLFLLDRNININFYINEMDSKDGANNEKDGEVYEKFSLELHCSLDFKLPNTYVMNYKIYNGPNKSIISSEYLNNIKLDRNAEIPAKISEPRYIEDREYIKPIYFNGELIVKEEFLIEEEKEVVQLSNFFPNGTVYRDILYRLSPEERSGMFETHFYENGVLIEDYNIHIYDVESDIVYIIDKCDTNVSFMIFVYCNVTKLKKFIPIITSRVEKSIFPNIDENGIPYYIGSIPPTPLNVIPPFPSWDIDTDYDINLSIIHENVLYKSLTASINIIPGSDIAIWKPIAKYWTIDMEIVIGDYVIYNSMLYRAIQTIIGGLTPSRNYEAFVFITILGEERSLNFDLPLLSREISIGGKFNKGGEKQRLKGNVSSVQQFECFINASR